MNRSSLAAVQQPLIWNKRPALRHHPALGRQQIWRERGGRFEIHRYLQGSKRYIVMQRSAVLPPCDGFHFDPCGDFPSLQRAKNVCKHLSAPAARESRRCDR